MRLTFHILRSLAPVDEGPLLEAVPVEQPDRRVLVWPGQKPNGELPIGNRFGKRVANGVTHSRPVWIEERPAGPLLSDLSLPLNAEIADHIMLQLCHALVLLHSNGQVHGELEANRIALDSRGRTVVLGAGRKRSTQQHDIESLFKLYKTIGGIRQFDANAGLRPCFASLESVHLVDSNALSALALTPISKPENPSKIEVMIATSLAALSIDEVGMDIGQDEQSQGLLDEWTGGTDDEAQERTGTLSLDALAEQRRLALLNRLGLDPNTQEVPEHIQALKIDALEEMKTMLLQENLDPLPSPGTLPIPAPELQQSSREDEITSAHYRSAPSTAVLDDVTAAQIENTESFSPTSEVTRIQPRPSLPEPAPTQTNATKGPLFWMGVIGWVFALVISTLFLLQGG